MAPARAPVRPSYSKFLRSDAAARRLRDVAAAAIRGAGSSVRRISTSQEAFARRRTFALLWAPRRYLGPEAAPLVLSLALRTRIRSRRWKEVTTPRPGWFMHHLELRRVRDIDAEIRDLIQLAWDAAA